MPRLARFVSAGLLAVSTAFGADLSGIWLGQMRARNGDQDVAFKFTQSGTALGGKIYGDYGSSPIVEGKVSGDQISFLIVTQEQAGNEVNESRVRFSGCLNGDEMELTRERESSTGAASGASVENRNRPDRPPQTIRLKRLL